MLKNTGTAGKKKKRLRADIWKLSEDRAGFLNGRAVAAVSRWEFI